MKIKYIIALLKQCNQEHNLKLFVDAGSDLWVQYPNMIFKDFKDETWLGFYSDPESMQQLALLNPNLDFIHMENI